MGAVQGNAIRMDLDFSPRLKKRTILAVAALCAFVSLTAQTVLRKSAGRWPALICSTLAGLLAFAWVRYVLREKQYASKLKPPQGLADADSHFETINGIAVHYKYTDVPQSKLIMHCSHGFGSNCFTWQRCREQLAGENKAIVVSHDAPGFGITERPKKTDDFAMPVNAKIASALIEKFSGWGGDLASKKKVFVGHSMGSIAASMATLSRPSEAAALILVAPALSAQPTQPSGRKRRSFIPIAGFRRFSLALLKPLLLFNLRNAVRRKGFWEKGLRLAWSDETKITAEVIDAYRYPSLAENWDEGLIKFTVAMSSFLSSKQTKAALLGEIIEAAEGGLPVLIIHGKEVRGQSVDRGTGDG